MTKQKFSYLFWAVVSPIITQRVKVNNSKEGNLTSVPLCLLLLHFQVCVFANLLHFRGRQIQGQKSFFGAFCIYCMMSLSELDGLLGDLVSVFTQKRQIRFIHIFRNYIYGPDNIIFNACQPWYCLHPYTLFYFLLMLRKSNYFYLLITYHITTINNFLQKYGPNKMLTMRIYKWRKSQLNVTCVFTTGERM